MFDPTIFICMIGRLTVITIFVAFSRFIKTTSSTKIWGTSIISERTLVWTVLKIKISNILLRKNGRKNNLILVLVEEPRKMFYPDLAWVP